MVTLIIFVAAVIVILWGISIYFVKTGKLKAQDWSLKALGLPQGSVRAIIALLLLFSLVYVIMTGAQIPDLPDWLVGILGTVIGFYFGAAMAPKPQAKEEEKPKA